MTGAAANAALVGDLRTGQYIALENKGANPNPDFLFLDGRTADGSVGLAPDKTAPYSGTKWQVTEVLQGKIAVEKQGQCLTSSQRKLLLKSIQADLPPESRRRIEIMLLADTGQSQTEICKALGCSQETARYWIAKAQAGQAHNWDEQSRGRPRLVDERYLNRLKELVNHSPREYGYSFSRWTGEWLAKHMAKELGITVSGSYINMLLKEMGLSARQKIKSAKLSQQPVPN